MTKSDIPDFEEVYLAAEDGLRLHARDYRPRSHSERLPLVCLPGLSRNARDFHLFAQRVAHAPDAPRRVVALDYRGRGLSAWDADPANYNIAVECRDVLTACAALGIGRCLFAGTSRGGLILHVMAMQEGNPIAGAILNDIGPEIEIAGLLEIRDYLKVRNPLASYEDAADLLARTHGATFPALARPDWLDMAEAIYAKKDGHLVPDFDPALADQLQAVDGSKPLPTLWPQYERLAASPLLVIRGEHSRLLAPATLERMKRPNVTTVTAPGQGHAPLLHHPDIHPVIADFLSAF